MKFGYYILNTYVPELDGESPELYAHWLEQIDAAEDLVGRLNARRSVPSGRRNLVIGPAKKS